METVQEHIHQKIMNYVHGVCSLRPSQMQDLFSGPSEADKWEQTLRKLEQLVEKSKRERGICAQCEARAKIDTDLQRLIMKTFAQNKGNFDNQQCSLSFRETWEQFITFRQRTKAHLNSDQIQQRQKMERVPLLRQVSFMHYIQLRDWEHSRALQEEISISYLENTKMSYLCYGKIQKQGMKDYYEDQLKAREQKIKTESFNRWRERQCLSDIWSKQKNMEVKFIQRFFQEDEAVLQTLGMLWRKSKKANPYLSNEQIFGSIFTYENLLSEKHKQRAIWMPQQGLTTFSAVKIALIQQQRMNAIIFAAKIALFDSKTYLPLLYQLNPTDFRIRPNSKSPQKHFQQIKEVLRRSAQENCPFLQQNQEID